MDIRDDGVYILAGGGGAVAGAIGEIFREAGARLVLVGPNEASLRPRAEHLGAQIVTADLTSTEAATVAVQTAISFHGRLDGLIHTVGAFAMAPAHQADLPLFDRMFDLNMRTLFCSVRAVLPPLLEKRAGFIAAISAGVAHQGGGAGMTAYAAAKGAVRSFLRALEAEVRPSGIHVAIVYPMGAIDTPDNRRAMPGQDPRSWIDPLEIGRALLFAATRGPRGDLAELVLGVRR